MAGTAATPVYLEVGAKRAFACALDWPGWCRAGKTPELALEALAAAAPRYAAVARRAGVRFPAGAADRFEVVERVPGSATTDFGAPGAIARSEAEPLSESEAGRMARLLSACWQV